MVQLEGLVEGVQLGGHEGAELLNHLLGEDRELGGGVRAHHPDQLLHRVDGEAGVVGQQGLVQVLQSTADLKRNKVNIECGKV